jgi:glycosyltransferase involved in cell wall biosynthesis
VKFSIVTPSFRNSEWLKLCVASVADQQGIQVEHIVQDACSDDGTREWLARDTRVKAFIEKDGGMYDAINRGYRRATGDIFAHLNSDEQYLPGALAQVAAFFERHPDVDLVLAGSVVVGPDGEYICHRPALVPDPLELWYRFTVFTASLFLRRSVVQDRNLFFDTRWKTISDFHWFRQLQESGVRMKVLDLFTSTFTETGANLGQKPIAFQEMAERDAMIPRRARILRPLLIARYNLRRAAAGHFSLGPTSYDLYTKAQPERRVHVDVPRPTTLWIKRMSYLPEGMMQSSGG